MNWQLAIESKRVPLLAVVLALFAKIGLSEGASIDRIAKPLHRFILSRLRSAESAVRRLIVAAARDIVLMPEDYKAAFEGVEGAVNDGTISMERLNESVLRILTLKEQYGLLK